MLRKTISVILLILLVGETLSLALSIVSLHSIQTNITANASLTLPASMILLGGASRWAAGNGNSALYVNWKDNYLAHHLTDGVNWGPWPQESDMDDWRIAVSYALAQYGFNVVFAGDIPANLNDYDLVVILAYWAVEPKHAQLIQNYLAGGGGVVLLSGVPPYFVDYEKDWWTTTNLNSIHDWFGASWYVNVGGSATVTIDNPFNTGLPAGETLCSGVGYSNAAVDSLDSDTQIVATWSCGCPYGFTHEYGQGKLYYQARIETLTTGLPEHELSASVEAPGTTEPDKPVLLKGTVYNHGTSNETNVELRLFIDGTMVDSVTIPELLSASSYTLSYLWTPSVEGIYNVTAYAPPIPDEVLTENNVAVKLVDVHEPPEGTVVLVEPEFAKVTVGATLTVNVNIRDVNDLVGYEFKLFYDKAVLNCTGIALPPDHFFKPQDPNYLFIIKFGYDNDFNATHGLIWVAMTLLYPEAPKAGSGTLVTIEYQTLTTGESALDLVDDKLADSGGVPITHTTIDGQVIVEVPINALRLSDINVDRIIDIFDISIVAVAFSAEKGGPRWNPDADRNMDGVVDIFDLVMVALNYGSYY